MGGPELALIQRIQEEGIPAILCINKIDTIEKAELLPVIAAYNEKFSGRVAQANAEVAKLAFDSVKSMLGGVHA